MISARPSVTQYRNNFFFHQPSFVFRNNSQNVQLFRTGENEEEDVRIYFTRNKEALNSLERSPFGGFIFGTNTRPETIRKLIAEIEYWCTQNGIREISIRNCPDVYDPVGCALMKEALAAAGFQIAKNELLQFISIDEKSSGGINRNRTRKLNDCIQAGFNFMQLGPEHIEEAYEIFVECRIDKNYPVTMSLQEFRNSFDMFPDQYCLFGVKDGKSLIAASVCVKVNDRIFYDFFHGDKLRARKFSPLTMLVSGLIDFCRVQGFELLDLGVSTDSHGINKGLTQFKNSFGAKTSQKLTFNKKLKD